MSQAWLESLQVLQSLGKGAFGEVFLAKLSSTAEDNAGQREQFFALKRSPLTQLSESSKQQALKEAELCKKLGLEHRSILRCFAYRFNSDGELPVLELLFELAPLGDLNRRIRMHANYQDGQSSGLPEPEILGYSCNIADALAYLHSLTPKVLHRDVKPANILLFAIAQGSNSIPHAKLADFGIAKIIESDNSLAGAIVGTPHYFSPEICKGLDYDERADAWALGVVLYEMLCLHRPFHTVETNLPLLMLRISEGKYDDGALRDKDVQYKSTLLDIVSRLLSTEVKRRYRASDVSQELLPLMDHTLDTATQDAVAWWRKQRQDIMRVSSDIDVSTGSQFPGLFTDDWGDAEVLKTGGIDTKQLQAESNAVTSETIDRHAKLWDEGEKDGLLKSCSPEMSSLNVPQQEEPPSTYTSTLPETPLDMSQDAVTGSPWKQEAIRDSSLDHERFCSAIEIPEDLVTRGISNGTSLDQGPVSSSHDIPDDKVPFQIYVGWFTHPAFSNEDIQISIDVNHAGSGQWTAVSKRWRQTEEVFMSDQGKAVVFSSKDGRTQLTGRFVEPDVIEGVVVQNGLQGGHFKVTRSIQPLLQPSPEAKPRNAAPRFVRPVWGSHWPSDQMPSTPAVVICRSEAGLVISKFASHCELYCDWMPLDIAVEKESPEAMVSQKSSLAERKNDKEVAPLEMFNCSTAGRVATASSPSRKRFNLRYLYDSIARKVCSGDLVTKFCD